MLMAAATDSLAAAARAAMLVPTPYTIVIDSREQAPYRFTASLRGPRGRLYAVQTTVSGLASGDYSLVGMESRVAVERKSLADAYSTLGQGRARFIRELQRLNTLEFAAIVIEADWTTIMTDPPARSRLLPKTVFASVCAWQQRYSRVHWWAVPGRDVGEAVTIRILDRFWREREVRA
jgi:DNA excision repair protein ERCC-4